MAWLAHLDAKTRDWPPVAKGLYVVMKWALAALGAFALSRVLLDRIGVWSLY
jgi:hypothetical protein